MKRRTFLKMTGAAAAASAFPAPFVRAATPEEYHIAAILSFSGAYGLIGGGMRRGAELAVAERGGKVLGVPIRFSWEDDETKPQPAVQKATRLLGQGANMLFGAISSASTLALQSLSTQRRVPHLVTISADDALTVPGGARYSFRTSNTMGMEVQMCVEFARRRGLRKVYVVTADYQVTRTGFEQFAARAAEIGYEIVGSDFAPLGTRDFSVIIDKMARSDADAILVMVTGNDGVTFVRQAGQVALGADRVIFGPVLQDEVLASVTGPAALGVNSGVRYHFSLENDPNRAFVEAYRAAHGEFPSSFAGEAYDGMRWWLRAVDESGSWDVEDWVKNFESSVYADSVEGRKQMRACDHQAAQVGLWGEVVKGEAPLPELTMRITDIFEADRLFGAC